MFGVYQIVSFGHHSGIEVQKLITVAGGEYPQI
jgi:hypothetical protein